MSNNDPIFNIGAVSRMTGIPAATLRIWERRYEFPECTRTDGGHRLYSQHEIDRLRWVKLRTDSGMQIRQAIIALRAQEDEREANPDPGIDANSVPTEPVTSAYSGDATYINVLQQRLTHALIQHQLDGADAVFDEAMALYKPEDVMLKMIQPTLNHIGQEWSEGKVRIATEHFVSHYLRQRMIVWLRTGPSPYDAPTTVLACAPGDYHEGSLLITGAMLRRRRWPVSYLGQSIPLEDVAAFASENNAAAVVFVAMVEETAQSLVDLPVYFPNISNDTLPIIAYGGRIFNIQPEWRSKVPGLFLGATIEQGVETLDKLLHRFLLVS